MAERAPVITACSYSLFHCPSLAMEYGTTPAAERATNPGSAFLAALPGSLRSFAREFTAAEVKAAVKELAGG